MVQPRGALSDCPLPGPAPCRGRERARAAVEASAATTRAPLGAEQHPFHIVMAGLVPAIHVLANRKKGVVARVRPGHDEPVGRLKPRRKSTTRMTPNFEGLPPTSIALQILTPSPALPLAGGGSTSIGPAPFSGERARTASREAASTHAHTPNVTCRANQLRDFCVTGPCVCVESQQNKRREKSGFDNCFKAVWIVQSGREKISLSENRKSCTSSRRPDST